MDSQKVQCFLAVAKELNFSKAARRLYMSQSSVSYQIQALERELGVSLFTRTTTSTALTEAGKQFLPDAKKLSQIYQHIEVNMKKIRETQPIIFTVPPSMLLFDLEIYTELFAELDRCTNRKIEKTMIEDPDESIQELLDGQIDLLIVRKTNADPWHKQLKIYPLFHCQQYIVISSCHPLAAKDKITLKDIEGENVYISSEDPCFLPNVMEALADNQVKVSYQFLHSYQLIMPFIEMGQGITFTALLFPAPESVCFRPIDLKEDIQIALCTLKNHPAPEIPVLSSTIQQYFRNYPAQSGPGPDN